MQSVGWSPDPVSRELGICRRVQDIEADGDLQLIAYPQECSASRVPSYIEIGYPYMTSRAPRSLNRLRPLSLAIAADCTCSAPVLAQSLGPVIADGDPLDVIAGSYASTDDGVAGHVFHALNTGSIGAGGPVSLNAIGANTAAARAETAGTLIFAAGDITTSRTNAAGLSVATGGRIELQADAAGQGTTVTTSGLRSTAAPASARREMARRALQAVAVSLFQHRLQDRDGADGMVGARGDGWLRVSSSHTRQPHAAGCRRSACADGACVGTEGGYGCIALGRSQPRPRRCIAGRRAVLERCAVAAEWLHRDGHGKGRRAGDLRYVAAASGGTNGGLCRWLDPTWPLPQHRAGDRAGKGAPGCQTQAASLETGYTWALRTRSGAQLMVQPQLQVIHTEW